MILPSYEVNMTNNNIIDHTFKKKKKAFESLVKQHVDYLFK